VSGSLVVALSLS